MREYNYPIGETKRFILLYLLEHPEGVKEPDLRNFLKSEYNLSASRNIKSHLADMVSSNLIYKSVVSGHSNVWYPDPRGITEINCIIDNLESKLKLYIKISMLYSKIVKDYKDNISFTIEEQENDNP